MEVFLELTEIFQKNYQGEHKFVSSFIIFNVCTRSKRPLHEKTMNTDNLEKESANDVLRKTRVN